jgi:hypothetical protein
MRHDFRCDNCLITYETYIPPSSPIVSFCPKCGKKAKKVFSVPEINMGENWPQYNNQAGRTFNSRREEDEYFNNIGAVKV